MWSIVKNVDKSGGIKQWVIVRVRKIFVAFVGRESRDSSAVPSHLCLSSALVPLFVGVFTLLFLLLCYKFLMTLYLVFEQQIFHVLLKLVFILLGYLVEVFSKHKKATFVHVVVASTGQARIFIIFWAFGRELVVGKIVFFVEKGGLAIMRAFFVVFVIWRERALLVSGAFSPLKVATAAVKAEWYLKVDLFFFWFQAYWITLLINWTEYSSILPFKACCFTVSKNSSKPGTNFQIVLTSVSQKRRNTLCCSVCAIKFSHFASQGSGLPDGHSKKAWCMNFKFSVRIVRWVVFWARANVSLNFFN